MMGMFRRIRNDHAVSPVVGVMLMLVITVIIAAVVSAFAGGMAESQDKVPQVTIQSTFSISKGMVIRHAGGDPLAMHDIAFTIWDGPTFGPNVEQSTKQALNMMNMTGASGVPVMAGDGSFEVTVFRAGDALSISAMNCTCDVLQPNIAPSDFAEHGDNATYDITNGKEKRRWGLCLRNPDSIGKEFVLTVSDRSGRMIAQTHVTVEA